MTLTIVCPPDAVGQQGPPARAAASDPWRSLRDARGPLLLTGTGYHGGKRPQNLGQAWKT